MSVSRGSRVRVGLADGFNFVGTVRRVYSDSRGRRTILVEDSIGQERTVQPRYPHVEIHELDGGRGAENE